MPKSCNEFAAAFATYASTDSSIFQVHWALGACFRKRMNFQVLISSKYSDVRTARKKVTSDRPRSIVGPRSLMVQRTSGAISELSRLMPIHRNVFTGMHMALGGAGFDTSAPH